MASNEHTTAAIMSIGDELTLGQTLNTNSKILGERLMAVGIVPVEHVTVPDDLAVQVATLKRLAAAVPLVVVSGGLGPTADDLTREALAQAMGDVLVEDPIAMAQVESWFVSRGRGMPEINRVQALRPSRGEAIQNLNGTAPGLSGRVGTCDVFCLPGPPREMVPMFEQAVLPRLRPAGGRIVVTRVLHCFGIGESDLATRLGALMDRSRAERQEPMVGTTASGGVVSIRVRVETDRGVQEAEEMVERVMGECRVAAGPYAVSEVGDSGAVMQATLVELLQKRGETIGTVESCTGGLVGALLTDVPGSSAVFGGGLLTYSNALKTPLAGVDPGLYGEGGPGAVSRQTAIAMAMGGVAKLGVSHAVSLTGIAGPGGGSAEKPVGTVFIARASADGTSECRAFGFSGDRRSIRELAARSAIGVMIQHLRGIAPGAARMLRERAG